jgi:hypothetical protein
MYSTIRVTKDEIQKAIPEDSSHCMIAEAIKACRPSASRVSVDIQTIRWSNLDKGERYIFLTPPSAQKAILQFDEGITPKPFCFRLRGGQIIEAVESTPRQRARKAKYARQKREVEKQSKMKATSRQDIKVTAIKDHNQAVIIGGRAAPMTHVGRRRTFGVRAIVGANGRILANG